MKIRHKEISENELSSGKSIYYSNPEPGKERDLFASFYGHMLTEDIHLGIMPIGGRTKNNLFKITLKPQNAEVENLIKDSLPTHYGEPQDLKEAVCDFIDEAAGLLGYGGVAYYETVYYYKVPSKPIRFELRHIINNTIKDTFGLYWQYVPGAALEYVEGDKRFIWLPRKSIIKIRFPDTIGGSNNQRKLIYNLAWLSKSSVMPEFARDDMEKREQQTSYDFTVYRRNKDIFLARITQHLGWPARSLMNDCASEIYELYRHLKFEKTKAIIRETILHSLNKALVNIGKEIGFNAAIEISGIPSVSDFDTYIKQLLSGEMSFKKVAEVMRYDF
ncbi:MAG: hypothetical protein PHG87_05955 [Candidatus Omnitrophica bacterium]|nr:hypothetical protein [Candidatus Omnitrophota bacterium]